MEHPRPEPVNVRERMAVAESFYRSLEMDTMHTVAEQLPVGLDHHVNGHKLADAPAELGRLIGDIRQRWRDWLGGSTYAVQAEVTPQTIPISPDPVCFGTDPVSGEDMFAYPALTVSYDRELQWEFMYYPFRQYAQEMHQKTTGNVPAIFEAEQMVLAAVAGVAARHPDKVVQAKRVKDLQAAAVVVASYPEQSLQTSRQILADVETESVE